jgi:site-specific DNA-cytosine methylase
MSAGISGFGLGFERVGIEQSDSARYKQMGNAVTVSVAVWIGRRLVTAEREA